MDTRYALSLVLNAHLPYVKEFTDTRRRSLLAASVLEESDTETEEIASVTESRINPAPSSSEESWFFEAVSETWLPLLSLFDRLDADHIPFRLGISLSPILAQMFGNELLMKKYSVYLDNQIEFGKQELERLNGHPQLQPLAKRYFDQAIDRRAALTARYENNIFKALHYYQRKRKIEFLAAPATNTFLPFLHPFPEAVQAQMETALAYYRYALGINPQGFWLPDLGWAKELDPFLRSYGFNYTIVDSHGMVFGYPPPSRGTFFPVRTAQGIFVLARDFNACANIAGMRAAGQYLDTGSDAGFELPIESLGPFLAQNGARCQTGYKYRRLGDGSPYDPAAARALAGEQARSFLETCGNRLKSASQFMTELPISLCAFNADDFGRRWHEGPLFLESLFRFAASYRELQLVTPSEYLDQQPLSQCEVSMPEYSSWDTGGYAGGLLDSSNDWLYRHLNRSINRMIELAERFSRNSGLKERALNQAAREILLAMSSDWPAMLSRQSCTDYARRQIEDSLRNFTTIYEALGSNYISAEWLTNLERRHDIFPNINYRVFKRKE